MGEKYSTAEQSRAGQKRAEQIRVGQICTWILTPALHREIYFSGEHMAVNDEPIHGETLERGGGNN